MKRLTRFQENISVKKATNYAIIINSLEILLILGVMALVVISPQYDFSPRMVRLLVGVAAFLLRGKVERMHRSALILTFGGGTNEIQRDIIGMVALGLPRVNR